MGKHIPKKAYSLIDEMYIQWNLPATEVWKLDTWELWNCTKEELERALYKIRVLVPTANFVVDQYKRMLMHKGILYETVWQNDSAKYFFSRQTPPDAKFIVSVRSKEDIKVALIQRRWT